MFCFVLRELFGVLVVFVGVAVSIGCLMLYVALCALCVIHGICDSVWLVAVVFLVAVVVVVVGAYVVVVCGDLRGCRICLEVVSRFSLGMFVFCCMCFPRVCPSRVFVCVCLCVCVFVCVFVIELGPVFFVSLYSPHCVVIDA